MEQNSSKLSDSPTDFTETQKEFILDTIGQAVAKMGQDQHEHGGVPTCESCQGVALASIKTAKGQGVADTVAYYSGIPGVPALRKVYEAIKSEAEAGQELITIEG